MTNIWKNIRICITRLAVAFDFQILDLVPTEPTDICPQIIVTQSKVYRREDL